MKTLKLTEYLNETRLGEILKFVFEDCEIISQYRVKTPIKTMIVDYMVQTKFGTMFVEFNGHFHYQKSSTQFRDLLLSAYCSGHNISLVSIPYFIQLDSWSSHLFFSREIIEEYFSKIDISTTFAHGFISEKIVLPCDYNAAGWNKFAQDTIMILQKDQKSIAMAIYDSLEVKLNKSKYQVLPLILGVDMIDLTPSKYFEHYPS